MSATECAELRYGRLLVVGEAPTIKNKKYLVCKCDCGTVKTISREALRAKLVVSCGCKNRERIAALNRTHGHTVNGKITLAYSSWAGMLTRCNNPNVDEYPNYGGRGIRVCERWMKFENFLADMGEPPTGRHSIDRFPDKNGNYEPGNCRWATRLEQNRNQRSNVILTWQGESMCVTQWAERLGVRAMLIRNRLRRGWSVERAMTTPILTSRFDSNNKSPPAPKMLEMK